MIIPMLCVTIFVILVVWFLLPRVARLMRSEERFSRNAETDLVCRLLLEKKKSAPGRKPGRQAAAVRRKCLCRCVRSADGRRASGCRRDSSEGTPAARG